LRLDCKDIFGWTWIPIKYKEARFVYNDYVFVTPTIEQDMRYCCTFNAMNPMIVYKNLSDNYLISRAPNTSSYDWNVETGFEVQGGVERKNMPLRPFKIGVDGGLNVYLKLNDSYCDMTTKFQ
ncbi:hypothetical protein L9F63_027696, partial [Diploptera punctata]